MCLKTIVFVLVMCHYNRIPKMGYLFLMVWEAKDFKVESFYLAWPSDFVTLGQKTAHAEGGSYVIPDLSSLSYSPAWDYLCTYSP